MDEQQEREQRGLVIAAKAKLERADDGRWFVPSQSGRVTEHGHCYVVKPDPAHPYCSCPDFTARHLRCKHIYAVEIVVGLVMSGFHQGVYLVSLFTSKLRIVHCVLL